MKEEVNQTNTQRLIHDFHGNLLNDYMLDENAKNSKYAFKILNFTVLGLTKNWIWILSSI